MKKDRESVNPAKYDAALARKARHRCTRRRAHRHQLGLGLFVVSSSVALAAHHQTPRQFFHSLRHHVPTLTYVGT